MNSVPAVIAALSLIAPAPQASAPPPAPAAHEAAPLPVRDKADFGRAEPRAFREFQDSYRPDVRHQVHIEQRVIIRISPGPPTVREERLARLPRADRPARYKEKKFHGCIPIEEISGSEPSEDNRLLLFMRDHRVLSAALDRACDPDDFYLGFYVERNADGMLCRKRDKLQARTGATCEVAQLSQLVAVKD
jgi:hypothetical protein